MPESQTIPGKRQAVTSMVLAIAAFLCFMFVPMLIIVLFTLILGIIGLILAIRAGRRGYHGFVKDVGLMLSIINIALCVIMLAVFISTLTGMGGDL